MVVVRAGWRLTMKSDVLRAILYSRCLGSVTVQDTSLGSSTPRGSVHFVHCQSTMQRRPKAAAYKAEESFQYVS